MNFHLFIAALVVGFSLSSPTLNAQTRRGNVNPKSKQASVGIRKKKIARTTQQQRQQQQQRETVLTALREAGDAASLLTEHHQQAQSLAAIAEVMCKHDEPTAHSLFARAWSAATTADRDDSDATQNLAQISADAATIPSSEARDSVLVSVARCDDELAQKFLRARENEIAGVTASTQTSESPSSFESRSSSTASSRKSPWGELSPAAYHRLALARTLLEEGETRAIPTLLAPLFRESVTAATIEFLIHLRRRDANIGDKLFAMLLRSAPTDGADANSVLLAGAYLISPAMLTVIDTNGGLQSRLIQTPPAASSDAQVSAVPFTPDARRAFADFAARVLLQAQIEINSPAGERVALLFALDRTLPFFARENLTATPGLRARRDALAAAIDHTRREQLANAAETIPARAARQDDPLRSLRGQIRTLPEGSERDAARAKLAHIATRRRRWADARLAAAAITDLEIRSRVETSIRKAQIARLVDSYADATQDDFRRAARFVEESDVPPLWKAWGYAQAAQLAFRRNAKQETRTLLDEAVMRARATADRSQEQIAALLIVTTAASEIEPHRTPELLAKLVRVVNASKDFDGEFHLMNSTLNEINDSPRLGDANNNSDAESEDDDSNTDASPFDFYTLERLFARIAQKDFPLAIAEARNIERTLPRTLAITGVARTTLASGN